jgi:hypothetical protein
MYMAVINASPQNMADIPRCLRRARAMATTVWLRRSATQFYCRLYGVDPLAAGPPCLRNTRRTQPM